MPKLYWQMMALMSFSVAAVAAEADWQRCRVMTDPFARLKCYDELYATPAPALVASTETPVPATAAVASTATPTAQAVAPVVPAASAQERFGLENKIREAESSDALESSIPGEFKGWQPKQRFTLDNGQVWQIADGSEGYFHATDPKVRIERGVFSAFFMHIEGLNKAPKVKRIK